jgi:hypothetical protein
MSYEEKGAWVYVVVFVGTSIAYVAVILGRAAGPTALADVPYRAPMLWTMGISIGLSIIGRIALEILRPSDSHKPDVRDKDIGRHSEYVGGSVLAIAALVPFVLTLLEADYFWIGNSLYAAFALSATVGAATKIVAYRRGL